VLVQLNKDKEHQREIWKEVESMAGMEFFEGQDLDKKWDDKYKKKRLPPRNSVQPPYYLLQVTSCRCFHYFTNFRDAIDEVLDVVYDAYDLGSNCLYAKLMGNEVYLKAH
jgi:hypothetical protein